MATSKEEKLKGLKMRHIELEDLDFVNKFSQIEHFDVDLESLKLYYQTSNTKLWRCVENEQGEIVAIDIGNLMPNGVNYSFSVIVHPQYRGMGISSRFKEGWAKAPFFGSESAMLVAIFQDILQCWLGKMLVLYGNVSKRMASDFYTSLDVADFQIQTVDARNVSNVCKYDRGVIKLDRSAFLKKWCCSEGSHAVLALKGGKCVGFGVLRRFVDTQYGITPLYADDCQIARSIFAHLVLEVEDNQLLYVPAQADKRVSLEFCHRMQMQLMAVENRDCTIDALDYAKSLDMAKVYTTHDYWAI